MKYLFFLITVAILASCTNVSKSGKYIIFKVTNDPSMQMATRKIGGNVEVEEQLKSAFIGKTFDINFEKDFITLGNKNSKLDQILFSYITGYEGINIWQAKRIFGNVEMNLFLKDQQDGILTLGINYHGPRDQPVIIPAQLGAKLEGPGPDKQAMVIFSLKKLDK